jgi:signal transduction histidine kinase
VELLPEGAMADLVWLRQILMNPVGNAIPFAERG